MNEAGNRSSAGEQGSLADRRSQAKLWVAVGIAVAVVATGWLAYSYRQSDAAASAAPAALPQVVVSKPLVREVDSRLGFLGQFSAVEQVELPAFYTFIRKLGRKEHGGGLPEVSAYPTPLDDRESQRLARPAFVSPSALKENRDALPTP